MKTTTEEALKALDLVRKAYNLIANTGKGGLLSGHLYGEMMADFTDVNAYQKLIDMMVRTGIINLSNHVLVAGNIDKM